MNMKTIFAVLVGLVSAFSLFVSVLTFAVKSQKYGWASLWQEPDGFGLVTLVIGLGGLGLVWWLVFGKRYN